MNTTRFLEVTAILGTRDIEKAIEFYVGRLGFVLAFRDGAEPTNYAGVKRDVVEVHLQWQNEHEMSTTRLRLEVDDPDALFAEFRSRQLISEEAQVRNTPWGTREFAIYDPDRNALTFYRNLSIEERS